MDLNSIRKQYINIIKNLTDMDTLEDVLPDSKYSNYDTLMEQIIIELQAELDCFRESLNDEELLEFEDDIKFEESKINYIKEQITSTKECNNDGKKNLIFPISEFGNNLILSDIKDSDKHYYNKISSALNRLKEGEYTFNTAKQRVFTNNNKLNGVREIKEFAVRLTYIPIDSDSVLLINIMTDVKSQNSIKKRETIINRKLKINNQLYKLKEEFKDKDTKNKIIEQNNNLYEDIINVLDDNRMVQVR